MDQSERGRVTIPALHRMKRDGRKIVGVEAWDFPTARIVDRAGVDIVSVSDAVGTVLWGHRNPLAVTMEEMMTVACAVRRGVTRALVSVDLPYGPMQEGPEAAVRAAVRFVKEAGVDMVKLDGASEFSEVVEAVARAGVPVFAQFGLTPRTALKFGLDGAGPAGLPVSEALTDTLIDEARALEKAGAALLDLVDPGAVAGPKVVHAVAVPVLGGEGGGPWLDGRIRMAHAAIGFGPEWLDDEADGRPNVTRVAFEALSALVREVRGARPIPGWDAAPGPR